MTTNIINTLKKLKIKELRTNLEGASINCGVFYFIREGREDLFLERVAKSSVGLLILNREVKGLEVESIVVEEDQFYQLQIDLCHELYGEIPATKIIGVTGTNGKSSVTHICTEILNHNGIKSFCVGTLGVMSANKEIFENPGATTPSYVDLRRILYHLSDYEVMCLEVSSHALSQDRLKDIPIDISGWTNLSQDHLDYHNTMNEYYEAKAKLLSHARESIISYEDKSLLDKLKSDKKTFKVSRECSVENLPAAFKLAYNKSNLSLAITLCESVMGRELEIPHSLSLPLGRYTSVEFRGNYFVVDYAHTPDALENLVLETKKAFSNYEVYTVFGCGGDRDRAKRPLMLSAVKMSNKIFVTSDNPRTEDPNQIISDIVKGASCHFETIVDRKSAIRSAILQGIDSNHKVVVLIAGKGHETYQDINGVKEEFSDFVIIEELLKEISDEK